MNPDDASTLLRKVVDSVYPLEQEDWSAFNTLWKPFHAKRKQILTAAGDVENYLYFVQSGVQRVFYYDGKGREVTLVFTYSSSFGGVLDALFLQCPSGYNYETVTQSEFLRADYLELLALMDLSPAVERLIRLGLTQAFSGILERLVEVQCFSPEENFEKLLGKNPNIVQFVPHKYLAGYLGIDPGDFVKLMNEVRG